MKDVVDALAEDESNLLDVDGIFISPPDVNMDSDEDSASEDEGGLVDNLTGRQLLADAEISLSDGQTISNEAEFRAAFSHQAPAPPVTHDKWTKEDFLFQQDCIFPVPNYEEYRDFTPVQFFEIFFNQEIITHMVQQSNLYSLLKNYPELKVNAEEMKCFLGILINTGYNGNPQQKLYWDQGDDTRNHMIYRAMRRDRFVQIMQSLHCADNTHLDSSDKFSKIRPLLDMLKRQCLSHFKASRNLSYDESMIKYYGKHGCKQFIRGKPIRFGYKAWCLNQTNGYLVNFELYQGSRANTENEDSLKVGKAATPLLRMIQDFPADMLHLPFRFYFDNLFTGMNLLNYLKSLQFGATGTIRQNRIPKSCPVLDNKAMKKKPSGSHDYASTGQVVIVKWKDNQVVSIASTAHDVAPLSSTSRYSREERKRIQVPIPRVFLEYNKSMGGTDQMDGNVAKYRIATRGKNGGGPFSRG